MTDTKTDSVIEGNKLIADYMGYDLKEYIPSIMDTEETKLGKWVNKEFFFHSDWNELMAVIEKIDRCPDEHGCYCQSYHTSHTFYIHYNSGSVVSNLNPQYKDGRHRGEHETRIANVYKAVIQFIQWYNSQTPTP